MNTIRTFLAPTSLLRGIVAAFACSLLLLSSASPAAAISADPAAPSEGVPNLENIQGNTEEFMSGYNRMPGMKETQKRAAAGNLNSVQGGADLDEMVAPEDAQDATTPLDNMQKGLNKLLGND